MSTPKEGAMELQEINTADDLERSFNADKPMADQLLQEHTVKVSNALDLPALMPYLIQHRCLNDQDVDRFPETESRKTNNLKFKRLVQQRGVFNAFMNALVHYNREEREEGAHRELLESLELGIRRVNFQRRLSSAPSETTMRSLPSRSTSEIINSAKRDVFDDVIEKDIPPNIKEEEEQVPQESQEDESELVHHHERRTHTQEPVNARTREHDTRDPYPDVKGFKYFLQGSVLFICITSPILFIGGITLIVFSGLAFSEGKSCDDILSEHSLTVFNLLGGVLCLAIPCLLIILAFYYCLENRISQLWEKEFRILSCKCLVIWITITLFLTIFILAVAELLYALVYIAPQVYTIYGNWNKTQCSEEVFITSFSILNTGGIIVVILTIVLGIYLSILYFRWVTDPKKPGTLKVLIVALFSQKTGLSFIRYSEERTGVDI